MLEHLTSSEAGAVVGRSCPEHSICSFRLQRDLTRPTRQRHSFDLTTEFLSLHSTTGPSHPIDRLDTRHSLGRPILTGALAEAGGKRPSQDGPTAAVSECWRRGQLIVQKNHLHLALLLPDGAPFHDGLPFAWSDSLCRLPVSHKLAVHPVSFPIIDSPSLRLGHLSSAKPDPSQALPISATVPQILRHCRAHQRHIS